MTSSQQKSLMDQIQSDDPLPKETLVYLEERGRNEWFHFIHTKLAQARKERGLTKKKLARRLGKDPAQIHRLLGAPGNWTLDTLTDLLLGICKEEIVPESRSFLNRHPRNERPSDVLEVILRDTAKAAGSSGVRFFKPVVLTDEGAKAETGSSGVRYHVDLQKVVGQ